MSSESYLVTAARLTMRTAPFVLLNAGVYFAFFAISVVWIGFWIGLAFLLGKLLPILSWVCVIIAFATLGGFMRFGRRYILYLVKGGHIAVLTHFLAGRDLPGGKGQIAYGKEVVQQQFLNMNLLMGLDMLIDGTVKAFTRRFLRITDWLPLPGDARELLRWAMRIVERSLTYVDEAILSYSIRRGEENVWSSARQGLILYAQSYKPILLTALKTWFAAKLFYFVSLVVVGVPAALLMLLAAKWYLVQIAIGLLALFAARLMELALFEPFGMTYTLVTYHREIDGKIPDPTWDQRLSEASDSFRQLTDKARGFVPGGRAVAAATAIGAGAAPGASPAPGAAPIATSAPNPGAPPFIPPGPPPAG